MTTTGLGCPGSTCPDDRPSCSARPAESRPPLGLHPLRFSGGGLAGTQGCLCCRQGGSPSTASLTCRDTRHKPLAHSGRHGVTEQTLTPSQTRLDAPLHACNAHVDKPKTPCRVCQTLPDLQTQSHIHARLCVPRGCQSVPLSLLETHVFQGSRRPPVSCLQPQAWTCWSGLLTVGCWAGRASML